MLLLPAAGFLTVQVMMVIFFFFLLFVLSILVSFHVPSSSGKGAVGKSISSKLSKLILHVWETSEMPAVIIIGMAIVSHYSMKLLGVKELVFPVVRRNIS